MKMQKLLYIDFISLVQLKVTTGALKEPQNNHEQGNGLATDHCCLTTKTKANSFIFTIFRQLSSEWQYLTN